MKINEYYITEYENVPYGFFDRRLYDEELPTYINLPKPYKPMPSNNRYFAEIVTDEPESVVQTKFETLLVKYFPMCVIERPTLSCVYAYNSYANFILSRGLNTYKFEIELKNENDKMALRWLHNSKEAFITVASRLQFELNR